MQANEQRRLLVIDGLDGSGKATQVELLKNYLENRGIPVKAISFPDYAHDSSALIKMYLRGNFGNNPNDVNSYAASAFYAVDRFASYKQYWQREYENGTVILCDRYTTSNAIHQMAKLSSYEWDGYLNWLWDFEFQKMRLPAPSKVFFLEMSPEVSQKLLYERYQGDESKKDIHERDAAYLHRCQAAAAYVARKWRWSCLRCDENGAPLPKEVIFERLLSTIEKESVLG